MYSAYKIINEIFYVRFSYIVFKVWCVFYSASTFYSPIASTCLPVAGGC